MPSAPPLLPSPLAKHGRTWTTRAGVGLLRGVCFVGSVMATVAVLLAFVPDATSSCSTGERLAAHLRVLVSWTGSLDGPCLSVQRLHPLAEVVAARSLRTFGLVGGALAGAALVGVALGVAAARHPHRRSIRLAAQGLRLASGVPALAWGATMILLSIAWLGWLPFFGAGTGLAHTAWTLLLPILVLIVGDGTVAAILQGTEAETQRALRQPHLQALRAAGLPTAPHVRYALLAPLSAMLASRLAYLLGLSAVVEVLFGWQGIGWQLVESLTMPAKDIPLVLALTGVLVGTAYASQRLSEARWLQARARRATLPPSQPA